MIYFDNAATSLPKPPAVAQAVSHALTSFGGAGRGGHPAALEASRCIFRARKAVADLLGSSAERTVFTANATESLNTAICGLLSPNDHVITTALEHNSVLRPLYRLAAQGMGLSIVPIDGQGALDYDDFPRLLQPHTRAVVCTHASNVTGRLLNLERISAFCQQHGLLLIVDASQTAGVFPLSADECAIDVLCFTGHKSLFGPQGTGGFCLRKGLVIPPQKVGGSGMHSFSKTHPAELPESLEAGTLNAHGIAGLLAGVEFIQQTGLDTIRHHEMAIAAAFRAGIAQIPQLVVYGDSSAETAPIVSLNIGCLDAAFVGDMLANEYNICVRTGAHCAPLVHQALGTEQQGAVRFSFSFFNTFEEVSAAVAALKKIGMQQGACV